MRPTRLSLRRVASTLAAGILIAGSLLAGSAALAAPEPTASPDAAAALVERLGDRSAGTYFDTASGQMVITVTDAAAAQTVRAAGAVPKIVPRGAGVFARVTAALQRSATIAGTAWYVDPVTDQAVVEVDSTVTGVALDTVRGVARTFGEAVRIEAVPGTLSTTISGGQAIYGGSSRCSLGFNVRSSSGTRYFLTAGHCTNIASTWYANSSHTTLLGPRIASSFPGNDFGIVRHDNSSISRPGNVYLWNGTFRDITGAGNAFVNQSVLRSGSTSGLHSGIVTALNVTVNYPQGTVFGLVQTTVCAEPGDSGGPLFAGNTALGLTSGGSGDCTSGGTTFFQPVTEPLSVYGVNVY